MKRLLCISRKDDRKDYDTATSMVEQLALDKDGGLTTTACFLEDLAFIYDGTALKVIDSVSGQDIANTDAMFFLGWFKEKKLEDIALSAAIYAEAKGIPFLNAEVRINRSKTKLSQYVHCALQGIHTTPFIYIGNSSQLPVHLTAAGIEYPIILKAIMASRGKDNYLVDGNAKLTEILAANPETPFVIQSYVPNDGDYRILVMGDEVKLVMHRKSASQSHLNNTSQGGTATLVDPSSVNQTMLQEAKQIARLLNRDVTGVDMIVHRQTGQYYFLEANNMPQLSTGSFVSEKMQALNSYLTDWAHASIKKTEND